MQSIVEDLREQNVEIIAISADSVDELNRLKESKGFTFPLLSDPDLVAIDVVGLRHPNGNFIEKSDIARPAMFLLGEDRKILWKEYPDNWRRRPTAETVLLNIEKGGAGHSGY